MSTELNVSYHVNQAFSTQEDNNLETVSVVLQETNKNEGLLRMLKVSLKVLATVVSYRNENVSLK